MINQQNTFIELCLSGDAFLDEIDDFIDQWHDDENISEEINLHDYLGMSWNEYSMWVNDSDILSSIISARRKRISIDEELNQETQPLAARAINPIATQKMLQWLEQRGNLE